MVLELRPDFNITDEEISKLPRISTHDRMDYRRCRRRWDWKSPLRQNLTEDQPVEDKNLWYGSAFHFALEDYHGWHQFPTPFAAFMAYRAATPEEVLPYEIDDLTELASGMLSYYTQHWYPRRSNDFKTFTVNGVPQVEVDFEIVVYRRNGYSIPNILDLTEESITIQPNYTPWFVYTGTFDRVVTDRFDRLWVVDYKTGSSIDKHDIDLDPQISAYVWAANLIYGVDFEGVLWHQFLKAVPEWPTLLKGGNYSTDKRQKTTASIYQQALMEKYGKIPNDYLGFISELQARETPEGDAFVKWETVRRNAYSVQQEQRSIMVEASEMLNADIPIYKNAIRDRCSWDCKDFKAACLMMDDGSDYQHYVLSVFKKKAERNPWRKQILTPKLQEMPKVERKRVHLLLER